MTMQLPIKPRTPSLARRLYARLLQKKKGSGNDFTIKNTTNQELEVYIRASYDEPVEQSEIISPNSYKIFFIRTPWFMVNYHVRNKLHFLRTYFLEVDRGVNFNFQREEAHPTYHWYLPHISHPLARAADELEEAPVSGSADKETLGSEANLRVGAHMSQPARPIYYSKVETTPLNHDDPLGVHAPILYNPEPTSKPARAARPGSAGLF